MKYGCQNTMLPKYHNWHSKSLVSAASLGWMTPKSQRLLVIWLGMRSKEGRKVLTRWMLWQSTKERKWNSLFFFFFKKKKEGRGKRRGILYCPLPPNSQRQFNLIIIRIFVFFSTCVDFYIEIRLLILKWKIENSYYSPDSIQSFHVFFPLILITLEMSIVNPYLTYDDPEGQKGELACLEWGLYE